MVILYKKTRLKWLFIPIGTSPSWYKVTILLKDRIPEKDYDLYTLSSVSGFWEMYYKLYFKIFNNKLTNNNNNKI